MGKKKKSKNNALALDLLGSPQPGDVSAPADYKREEIDSPFVLSASVLEERLRTRKIPLVDDGIREKDIRNPLPMLWRNGIEKLMWESMSTWNR